MGPKLVSDFETMVIRMERSPGMPGPESPPQYSIEIHGSGLTIFESGLGVEVRGKRKGRVSSKKVRWLLSQLMGRGFFSMRNSIPTTTDIPTTSVSVRIGTVSHKVLDESGSSVELTAIERLIHSVGGTSRWLRPTDATRKPRG